jgi:glycosyl transferase family 2
MMSHDPNMKNPHPTSATSMTPPFISVIVPVHSCGRTLSRCLHAVRSIDIPREQCELIVVDDASEDDSSSIAAEYADAVIRLPGYARGAGYARNRGAEVARGEIIVFLSADVCVPPDSIGKLVEVLTASPDVGAVYGAYDPPSENGLLTHFQSTYQLFLRERGAGETDAFFAGFGAIRRDVLLSAGMFDEWREGLPRVAASELGQRIRSLGYRILVLPEIRAVHLKQRRLHEMIVDALRDHGVPYESLPVSRADETNRALKAVRRVEQASRALSWISVGLAIVGLALRSASIWMAFGVSLALYIGLTLPLVAFAARRRGVLLALSVIPLHFGGFLLTGSSRMVDRIRRGLIGEPRPGATIEAFVEVGVETWPPVPRRRDVKPALGGASLERLNS